MFLCLIAPQGYGLKRLQRWGQRKKIIPTGGPAFWATVTPGFKGKVFTFVSSQISSLECIKYEIKPNSLKSCESMISMMFHVLSFRILNPHLYFYVLHKGICLFCFHSQLRTKGCISSSNFSQTVKFNNSLNLC